MKKIKETTLRLELSHTFKGDMNGDKGVLALVDSLRKCGVELAGKTYTLSSWKMKFVESKRK